MRREWPSLSSLVLLCLAAAHANAQPWSGILAPSRAINWTTAGVAGSIPTRSTICATLNPGATAAQINSAIASCPANQVVKLNAGTYNLSGGIDFGGHSNVTLRGAGPDQTFVKFSAWAGCMGLGGNVCVINPSGMNPDNVQNSANWTAGYSVGTTSITLSSTTGLSVGSILFLDQLNDANTDNGQVWMCDLFPYCATEGGEGLTRANRAQVQPVVVTSVNGQTVGINRGLYMPNWRSSQSPQGWWSNDVISGDGIEDISLDYTAASGAVGIFFGGARDCWVKNVRSLNSARAAVWMDFATRITVRDSYFFGTQNAASQSYGIETDSVSDLLVENNIFQHVTAGTPLGKAAAGTAYGYNFAIDDYYCGGTCPSDWQQALPCAVRLASRRAGSLRLSKCRFWRRRARPTSAAEDRCGRGSSEFLWLA